MNPNEDQQPEQEAVSPTVDDPRIVEALEQYLAAVEAGERPNRQAFLARHAEIAGALVECLDGLEALQAASSSGNVGQVSNLPPHAAEWQPEAPLGDFRIVREIGRGGMGMVYEAVQLSLGRKVALKVLPFAAALDAKQLQRFKNEAQAAAHLHHTSIVPVYAVGVERGVHFYAMQLIAGQNLAAVIAEMRRGTTSGERSGAGSGPRAEPTGPYVPLSSPPAADTGPNLRAQLSTQRSDGSPEFFRTVARLTLQVAEALDYAHGMGIIHRDIKPANLLVDDRGNVWVTDFGLAQFHADAGLTQTGDLVGTLRYMSPEQAGGPRTLIDHRTDVYSIGATLYELLTLRPIFDGTDRQTLLHQILYQEPRPPRAIDRSIPVELETIVLKAVGKVPSERYATARDFADDLSRFLEHKPIRARRATLSERARKWTRRHPSVVVAAVALCVLTAAGSLVSLAMIRQEQAKTRKAYEREREQFRIARQSVNELIRLAQEELANMPHGEGVRKRLLEAALANYGELIDQSREDDETPRAELAATQEHIKKILEDLAVLEGDYQLGLLSENDVLNDLHLTAEQREGIRALSQSRERRRHESFRDFVRLRPEQREQRFLKMARENDAAVKEILSEEQRHRFQQIVLQIQGPRAFRDTTVENELKLTAEQKERIRTIEAASFVGMAIAMRRDGPPGNPMRRDGPPGKGKPPKPYDLRMPPKPSEQNWKAASAQIQALLTPEQAKRWREMIGEPFLGQTHCSMPPPGHCVPPPELGAQ